MVLTQRPGVHQKLRHASQFPYHYGSHATLDELQSIQIITRFHTTMVLTQPATNSRSCGKEVPGFHTTMVLTQRIYIFDTSTISSTVSIPLWFSRNGSLKQQITVSVFQVSIPLWFSRNSFPQLDTGGLIGVSIPLWFSRNGRAFAIVFQQGKKFPYHYGSHATEPQVRGEETHRKVSIPLWFSRNQRN